MNIEKVTYKDYSLCDPNFIKGIELLAQGGITQAAHCFELAYEQVKYQDVHHNKYASFCGYARVLNGGDRGGLSLCREVARRELYDGDVFFNLAKAEWFFKARKRTIGALKEGLKIDFMHPGLRELRNNLGVRKKAPIMFLPREHAFNNGLGKLLRKQE